MLIELAQAFREHSERTPGRQTIGWVLLGGINTGADEVRAIAELLDGVRLRINLIDYNPIEDQGFVRPSDEERNRFFDDLQVLRAPVVRRYSGGVSCHAACGMLHGRPTAAADPPAE